MVEQQLEPGRQQVAGRVAAGVDEQQEEPLQLAVGQPVAVDLGLHEPGGDVVAGLGPLARRRSRAAYASISARRRRAAPAWRRRRRWCASARSARRAARRRRAGCPSARRSGPTAGGRRRRARGRTRRARSTSSTISRGQLARCGHAAASAFLGVNPRLTSSLNRSCSGGSIDEHHLALGVSPISSASAIITPRAAELNSFGWRLMRRMSAYRVIGPEPGAVLLVVPVHGVVLTQPGVLLPRVSTQERRSPTPGRSSVGVLHRLLLPCDGLGSRSILTSDRLRDVAVEHRRRATSPSGPGSWSARPRRGGGCRSRGRSAPRPAAPPGRGGGRRGRLQ